MILLRSSLLLSALVVSSTAWTPHCEPRYAKNLGSHGSSRRAFVETTTTRSSAAAAVAFASILLPTPAQALVKGNAPPPKSKASASDKPKCTNVDECQAMAEKRDSELMAAQEQGPPPKVAARGTRYRDFEEGDPEKGVVKEGNEVTMFYKVLKVGKRSYDGISGEATVVFSKGYGLEDDEKAPGIESFVTTVGSRQNVGALNDALVGMAVGGIRRFAVLPQRGWEKPTKMCDGGPGGQGAGGDLRTDYVVVPTATMVSTESCFDTSKLPFPTTYAEQRRMAQRFDQALIMEVQVVGINENPSLAM